jgi:lysozyme family protein
MSDFTLAIPVVLKNEGGYCNNASDPGGATNFGISIRYLIASGGIKARPDIDVNHDGKLDFTDIKAMSVDQAVAIYKKDWWDAEGYARINDQGCATKIFDFSVNMGHPRAHKLAQQGCVACGKPVIPDGVLGSQTIAAINSCDPTSFLFHLKDQAASFYRSLAAHNSSLAKFLPGWLKRAYS